MAKNERKRQRRRQDHGANNNNQDDAKTNEEEDPSNKKKAVVEIDPDGTLNVARGGTTVEEQQEGQKLLLDGLTPEEKSKVRQHLSGNQGDLAAQRREQLRQDDDNPRLSFNLTDLQRHHLQHRKNKRTKHVLERLETKRLKAAVSAVRAVDILQDDQGAGLMEAESEMERTTAITQTQLKRHHLDRDTARHIYDLQLGGPTLLTYDRSGRYSILAGRTNGHVALLDNTHQCLVTEFHLPNERIRDATFLHNFTMMAIAQRNHVYIYDHTGAEIHYLHEHNDPMKLAFLPYHWLLASIGRAGYLKYQDTSTGELVSTHRTRMGAPTALCANPANAVLHAGHTNGTVTLWTPAQGSFLAKMQCHKGASVKAIAIDLEGKTMVTAGQDRQIKIWDLRMYQERHAYFCAAGVPTSLDISQRGLLAVGHAGHVTVWSAESLTSKVKSPYLHHQLGPAGDNRGKGPVESVRFRPFEDVCGIGHASGMSSIVVPGSGEPTIDTSEYHLNPEQDVKQRREAEVRALLDKLTPAMITLDSHAIGGMEESDPATRLERVQHLQEVANEKAQNAPPKKEKTKKRGRSKIQTKLRRKQKNIVDQNILKLKEAREKEIAQQRADKGHGEPSGDADDGEKERAPAALKRFF